MKNTIGLLLVMLLAAYAVSAQSVSGKDVAVLEGGTWVGTLTYLDYGNGKKVSIKSNLNVARKADGVWTFEYIYPDEPKANGTSEIALADKGKTFYGQTVTEKRRGPDGTLQIVTSKLGDDNGKKATFRFTYLISASAFSIRKEVQYIGESDWFERSSYSWTR